MKIEIIKPYGLCPGTQNCIDKTLKIIKNNLDKNIYMIGDIIHNKIICDKLMSHGNVKILSDKNKSRIDLVKTIKTKNNICIFSAHGSDPKAIALAKAKKYQVYDLSCPFVSKILQTIKTMIKAGYFIAYYGIKNHPEAIAAQATGSKNLTIYFEKKDIKNILTKPKVCVVSQTTMEEKDFLKTKVWFKSLKNLKFVNTICASSKKRQTNALNLKNKDLVFVVSDPKSHNGLSLFELLKKHNKTVCFVDPSNIKVDKKILKNKKNCAIFSSSSVPNIAVDHFVKYLKQLI